MKNFDQLIGAIEKVEFNNIEGFSAHARYIGRGVAIDKKTYDKLNDIALSFSNENNLISIKEYFNHIFGCWVDFWNKNNNFQKNKDNLKKLYNSAPQYFYVIHSVYGLEYGNLKPLEYPNVTFIHKNQLTDYLKSHNIEVSLCNEIYSNNLKELDDFLVILRIKAITSNRARELSEEQFKVIENFLNFLNDYKTSTISIITPPYYARSSKTIIINDDNISVNHQFGYDSYFDSNLPMMRERCGKIFDFVFDLFSKSNKTNITKSLFVAINWIGKANVEKDDTIAFTEYIFALECLLYNASKSDIITPSIVFQITNKATLLLVNEEDEDYIEKRKNLANQLKKLYANRSGIVHGGKLSVNEKDVYYLNYILTRLVEIIILLYENNQIDTHDKLTNYINNLMYK